MCDLKGPDIMSAFSVRKDALLDVSRFTSNINISNTVEILPPELKLPEPLVELKGL